jgi:hypothetical protein
MIPSTYEDWKHCVTVRCGITLTPAYIEERLLALRDPRDKMMARFQELYGQDHLEKVIAWFERAKAEIEPS